MCWFHCRVEFGSIMLWYCLADRTKTFPRGIKVRSQMGMGVLCLQRPGVRIDREYHAQTSLIRI